MNAPTISTHVPLTESLPEEAAELAVGRADIDPPSLWKRTVSVTHKVNGRKGVIVRVDHAMCMFRAYYPDTKQFAPRTEWEHFRDWAPDVTFSPEELSRQAAIHAYKLELDKLDADALALASVLCEDADPAKSLAKLRMMMSAGLIKLGANAAVAEQAVADVKSKK